MGVDAKNEIENNILMYLLMYHKINMFAARFATPLASRVISRQALSGLSKRTLASLPSADVFTSVFPGTEKINITDYCAGKNVIIVGLPGAFTPT